jgi:hypothetical protein
MAGVTAQTAPSGKAAMVARNQASRKRGAGVEGLQNREKAAVLLVALHVLGAPGWAWAAHVMQFRPVGVEGPGKERTPESPEFRERLFHADLAGDRSGGGG